MVSDYRGGGELSTRDLHKMVQVLSQYSEQIDKLSLHVDVRQISELSTGEIIKVTATSQHLKSKHLVLKIPERTFDTSTKDEYANKASTNSKKSYLFTIA